MINQPICDTKSGANHKAMADDLNASVTVLHTDAAPAYKSIARDFLGHESVDHSHYEYVRGDVSTNPAESFFSQFKRSLDGTYHNVSKAHLPRYTSEFTFRWNTRKLTDHQRVERIVGGAAGRRLTYKPLTER